MSAPSGTRSPSGMSLAITFQVAFDAATSRTSHAACSAPSMATGPAVSGVGLAPPHVQAEDVEQRPVAHLAVDPAAPRCVLHRQVLEEGLASARREYVDPLLGVAVV